MNQFQHQMRCPIENRTFIGNHSDAAKRVSDIYNTHRVADPYGCIGFWIACALADGQSDMELYESKQTAIRHQKHNENWYTFIQIVPTTMTPCEAEVMLKIARMVYDAGGRMSDGFSRHDMIKRLGWEDQLSVQRGIPSNVRFGRNRN